MKLTILILSLLFTVLSAQAETTFTYKDQCIQFLQYKGFRQLRSFNLICSNADTQTLSVMEWVFDAGFKRADSLAFIAGGHPTSAAIDCLNTVQNRLGLHRSDSLGMICRDMSPQEYQGFLKGFDQFELGGETAYSLANYFSPKSLRSFLEVCPTVLSESDCSIYR